MIKSIFCSAFISAGLFGAGETFAQTSGASPVLLIESLPSDNPDYRRMIFVKYLSGNQVDVNYRAYTRSEFAQVPDKSLTETLSACSTGPATPLEEIKSFQQAEAKRKTQNQKPIATRFCIKNVQNWEEEGRDLYLDPIFHGLPYAAVLNN